MAKSKVMTAGQIKRARKKHGLTQGDLAKAVGYKGSSAIAYIEGGYKPNNDVLQRITDYFNSLPPVAD